MQNNKLGQTKNIAVAGTWAFVIVVSIGYFWNGLGTFGLYLVLFVLAMIFSGALIFAPTGEIATQTEEPKQSVVAQ
jgi:hypothetical protein